MYQHRFVFRFVFRVAASKLYCNFGDFCENFIFTNRFKRHFCDAKNLRLGHVLQLSVDKIVISLFLEGVYFHETLHMPSFAKIKPSREFPKLQ